MGQLTLKQCADALGLSKNAIKYRFKQLPPEYITRDENGVIYIASEALEALRALGTKQTTAGTAKTAPEGAESAFSVTERELMQEQIKTLREALEREKEHAETYRQQLQVKDYQIEQLNNELGAMRTLSAKSARLLTADGGTTSEVADLEPKHRRSIFSRRKK